ncbi:hypothetical protein H4684_003288 [Desulfomicrobium macestii]|uniref:Uncharacterized protein n=1 Tax=Desulfomicrobium macestii TaxID=90731 RepID=A0ABR9H7C9_9BACT|nr:hypothetical protein [Desulfomicrobium macestii]MBE1426622.1 hypothetical protein [Desulfomicrobium macestii]
MDLADLKEGDIFCVGLISGATIIGAYQKATEGIIDAFFVSLIRDPESQEKTFCFKPVLSCAAKQVISGRALVLMMESGSVIGIYEPAPTVLSAYKYFIDNEQLVGKVIYDHLYEQGPSKEFVDKLMADMPKPKPRCEDGVIKGVFGPDFKMMEIDEKEEG